MPQKEKIITSPFLSAVSKNKEKITDYISLIVYVFKGKMKLKQKNGSKVYDSIHPRPPPLGVGVLPYLKPWLLINGLFEKESLVMNIFFKEEGKTC